MTTEQLDQIKDLLLQLKEEYTTDVKSRQDSLSNSAVEESGDLSAHAFHMADQGSDTMDREQRFMFVERGGLTLTKILEALDKLDRKEYGFCVDCDEEINFERLEAIPHAELCITCKTNQERKR